MKSGSLLQMLSRSRVLFSIITRLMKRGMPRRVIRLSSVTPTRLRGSSRKELSSRSMTTTTFHSLAHTKRSFSNQSRTSRDLDRSSHIYLLTTTSSSRKAMIDQVDKRVSSRLLTSSMSRIFLRSLIDKLTSGTPLLSRTSPLETSTSASINMKLRN